MRQSHKHSHSKWPARQEDKPLSKTKSTPRQRMVLPNIYRSQKKYFEIAYKTGQDVWTFSDDLSYFNDYVSVLTEHLNPGSRILDLGCGRGMNAIRLAKKGFRVCALDLIASVLNQARRDARQAGVGNRIEFKAQDFLAFKPARSLFDGALDRGCFHHIPKEDWLRFIRNLRSSLKSNAFFLLVTFSDKSPCFNRQEGKGQIHRGPSGTSLPHYDYFFSPATIKKAFGRHFRILKIRHRLDKPYSFYYTLMRAK